MILKKIFFSLSLLAPLAVVAVSTPEQTYDSIVDGILTSSRTNKTLTLYESDFLEWFIVNKQLHSNPHFNAAWLKSQHNNFQRIAKAEKAPVALALMQKIEEIFAKKPQTGVAKTSTAPFSRSVVPKGCSYDRIDCTEGVVLYSRERGPGFLSSYEEFFVLNTKTRLKTPAQIASLELVKQFLGGTAAWNFSTMTPAENKAILDKLTLNFGNVCKEAQCYGLFTFDIYFAAPGQKMKAIASLEGQDRVGGPYVMIFQEQGEEIRFAHASLRLGSTQELCQVDDVQKMKIFAVCKEKETILRRKSEERARDLLRYDEFRY